MLAELALALTARADPAARRLGLVGDAVRLWSRAQRLRRDWAAHEARCRALVEQAMAGLASRRNALVLGSGLGRDVPVATLAVAFDTVILADAVHLAPIRLAHRRRPNVSFVTLDISGSLRWVLGEAAERADPLAAFRADAAIDLTISANLLSQLAIGPEEWLERHTARAATLPADTLPHLVRSHLDDLLRLPGRVVLLTDTEMREEDRAGRVLARHDLLNGIALPAPDETWDWPVAPLGEAEPDRAYVHRVAGYADLKAAFGAP